MAISGTKHFDMLCIILTEIITLYLTLKNISVLHDEPTFIMISIIRINISDICI